MNTTTPKDNSMKINLQPLARAIALQAWMGRAFPALKDGDVHARLCVLAVIA